MLKLNSYPFASRRMPVMAMNGVVATSQPLAAQAGLQMLREGGNAVDAALATAMALTVLEPTSNGIGSDAFALVWDGEALHGLNASGRWPSGESAERVRGDGHESMPKRGWRSVTVPGAPAAWHDLHERFGKLDPARLLGPAIDFAENGFAMTPVISELWQRAAPDFLGDDDPALAGWAETFTRGGQPPSAGDVWTSPGHARCLRTLRDRGIMDFYNGEIAQAIVDYATSTGGTLSLADLDAHVNEWVDPISMRYGELELWEIPPNGQGIAALQALGILDALPSRGGAPLDPERLHLQIEAMKLGFADTYRYVADPAKADVNTSGMLNADYLAARAALIGDAAATPVAGSLPRGGTVYLCACDRDGMMVSLIQSNYMGFGSGVVAPEVGVSFQNRATGFNLEDDHPNLAAPGKRPRHTIIPGFLTRNGQALGPFGVMGGEMQPQGHLQVTAGLADHAMNPQSVLDMPRWRWIEGLEVELEPGADPQLVNALAARGHQISVAEDNYSFGRGQVILRLDSGAYAGGSEPRTDGAAVGY